MNQSLAVNASPRRNQGCGSVGTQLPPESLEKLRFSGCC